MIYFEVCIQLSQNSAKKILGMKINVCASKSNENETKMILGNDFFPGQYLKWVIALGENRNYP